MTGEVTPNTRYLILGERPTDKTKEGALSSFTAIIKQANVAGVPTMSLKDFLNYVGYKPEERSVQLGHEGNELAAIKQARKNAKEKEAANTVPKKEPFKPRVPKPSKRSTF
jgi:hypothetical protein